MAVDILLVLVLQTVKLIIGGRVAKLWK